MVFAILPLSSTTSVVPLALIIHWVDGLGLRSSFLIFTSVCDLRFGYGVWSWFRRRVGARFHGQKSPGSGAGLGRLLRSVGPSTCWP
jgi:hypothetical protein